MVCTIWILLLDEVNKHFDIVRHQTNYCNGHLVFNCLNEIWDETF